MGGSSRVSDAATGDGVCADHDGGDIGDITRFPHAKKLVEYAGLGAWGACQRAETSGQKDHESGAAPVSLEYGGSCAGGVILGRGISGGADGLAVCEIWLGPVGGGEVLTRITYSKVARRLAPVEEVLALKPELK